MTTPALVAAGDVASAEDSVTPEFAQSTTTNDLLLAWANSNDSSETFPITIGGPGGVGWTLQKSFGQAYNWTGVWRKIAPSEGQQAPTFSDSGAYVTAGLCEFSGVNDETPLDRDGSTDAYGLTDAYAADTVAGDLVVVLSAWNGTNANPTFSQAVTGSNGTALSLTAIQGNSGASAAPFYLFSYAINDGTLGSDANEVVSTISEYENAPGQFISSYKPA